MKYSRTGYGLRGQGGPSPAWVDGWERTPDGWQLGVIWRERASWVTGLMPPGRIVKGRIFEPTTPGIRTGGSESRQFTIANLANLSQLLEPREIIAPMLPGAPTTSRHAIYVAENSAGRLYLPALLLLANVWLWSLEAIDAILTPNSLDAYLAATRAGAPSFNLAADARLASTAPTQVALGRIAWLAESPQARMSWSSVLANAYARRLDFQLPAAALSGWAWGVHLSSGFLVSEILSGQMQFTLRAPQTTIRVGTTLHSPHVTKRLGMQAP